MMAENVPTISVVTPNYNHGHLIAQTIRSVAAQTHRPIEHIIVDDGSTDDSREVIAVLAMEFPFVRLVTSDRNEGAAAAIYRGMIEAKGTFLMFLGADDALPSWSLERFAQVVESHPEAALICGDVEFYYQSTQRRLRRRYLCVDAPLYLSPDDLVEQQRRGVYVINGAAIIRRSIALEVGMDDVELAWHLDFICYNTIGYRHGVWYIPEVLHQFTVTGRNYSGGSTQWLRQEAVLDRVFEVLQSPSRMDVREKFRCSGVLSFSPFILRYILKHQRAREFLVPSLVINSVLISTFRKLRNAMPPWAETVFVRLRSHRTAT